MTAILPAPRRSTLRALREAGDSALRPLDPPSPVESFDERATRWMDDFRRTGSPERFEALAQHVHGMLLNRARNRCRYAAEWLDPHEVVQDTLVNIYRYPDRFEPRQPNAFRIWAARILDNVVRRRLRDERNRPPLALYPTERFAAETDPSTTDPAQAAIVSESEAGTRAAYLMFLQLYWHAFGTLTERERFVLQMVEVHGVRYAELGGMLGIRGDALKMVVFRARRRIFERMQARG
jgi:RNA polymerase sigma factor (sigma-70 family)